MSTGDIKSVSINSDGWTASVEIEGLLTGGTYDFGSGIDQSPANAKIAFLVQSNGFDANCNASTIIRTVYATKQVRKIYPDQATNDEVINGSNVILKVALSEYIFQPDSNITVNIVSGFYTNGTANNATISFPVANNSVQAYPKVIGNWSLPGYSVVTGDFDVSVCFAHCSATGGKMIRGVRFIATDEHSHSYSVLVTNAIVDSARTALGGNAIIEYIGRIVTSGFTIGDKITVNYIAYPIWGSVLDSSDGVNTAPTPLYAPQYYKLLADRTVAIVDSAAADDTHGSVVNLSVFNSQNPPATYKTIAGAINAIRTALSSADVSGGIIYLRSGNHAKYGATITSGTVANYWLEIASFPGEIATINTVSGSMPVDSYVKYTGLNITISTGNYATSEKGTWFHLCTDNRTGGQLIYNSKINYITYCILNRAHDFPYGTQNDPVGIFRGNSLNINVDNSHHVPYMFIGNKSLNSFNINLVSTYTGMTAPHPDNMFIGFNFLSADTLTILFRTDDALHGTAIIQNIFEKTTTPDTNLQLAGDHSTAFVNNVLLWNNTFVGERFSFAFNDATVTGVDPAPTRYFWSVKNNIIHRSACITDVDVHYGDPGPIRNGNWPVRFGVGFSGNLTISEMYEFYFHGFKSSAPNLVADLQPNQTVVLDYLKFTTDRSYVGTGAGIGDYHLLAGSAAIGKTYDQVLPYDLDGKQRYVGGDSGVYESKTPPSPVQGKRRIQRLSKIYHR